MVRISHSGFAMSLRLLNLQLARPESLNKLLHKTEQLVKVSGSRSFLILPNISPGTTGYDSSIGSSSNQGLLYPILCIVILGWGSSTLILQHTPVDLRVWQHTCRASLLGNIQNSVAEDPELGSL